MNRARIWAASVACLLVVGVVSGCQFFEEQQPLRETPRPPPAPQPETRPAEPPVPVKESYPVVILETSEGTIRIELWPDKAPKTVANFLQYVKEGHYDGTIFHRVIDGFMIQGGGFNEHLIQKMTREPIENEAKNGLSNLAGTIAMARTMQPHSATAQFYINVSDNRFLDYPGQDGWGYCVFGRVVEGMDVVDRIRKVTTGTQQGYQDVPVEPVIIERAVISES
jgi:peptidyl-prolyl cis-trans isomerase B (cyclophilin B)